MASQLAPWPSMAWGASQQHLPVPLAPSVLLSKIYPGGV